MKNGLSLFPLCLEFPSHLVFFHFSLSRLSLLMPLAAATAAAGAGARSPSQFGWSRASVTTSSLCCCSCTGSARRGTGVLGAAKKKKKTTLTFLASSLASIRRTPLRSNSHRASRSVARFASAMDSTPLYLGIDMGTSGGRAMVIDGELFFFSFSSMMPIDLLRPPPPPRPSHSPTSFSPSPSLHLPQKDAGIVVASAKKAYPPLPPDSNAPRDWAETWASALDDLLESLSKSSLSSAGGAAAGGSVLPRVASAAVAGTSASMLLVNAGTEEEEKEENTEEENGGTPAVAMGAPLAPVRLYCDAASPAAVAAVAALAPPGHQAAAPTSALSKLMDWWVSGTIEDNEKEKGAASVVPVVVSAADWLTARLGRVGPSSPPKSSSSSSSSSRSNDGQFLRSRLFVTDDNNQLKAGWDPGAREYEPWLRKHPAAARLAPRVLRPGDATGCEVVKVAGGDSSSSAATTTYLPAGCLLAGGTTDSIAATLAAGVRSTPGDAVTSLGSSLAIKLVSHARIDDGRRGVYSHLIPSDEEGSDSSGVWLVGGSSNAGCAVFRSEFGPDDSVLERLTAEIEKEEEEEEEGSRKSTNLNYYPLPRKGERFPVCDPEKQPVVGPRPASDALHLRAILEGITEIERAGYAALEELGAPRPVRVLTAGGGAKNAVWTRMRSEALSPAVVSAAGEGEAAYGAALLARRAVTGKW